MQSMQEVLEEHVERQTREITALHQKIAALGRKLIDQQRDESKVHDAERIVLTRAVEFVDALNSNDFFISYYGEKVRDNLRESVAMLLAAEAAS